MNRELVVQSRVIREIRIAFGWYERECRGLGREFLAAIESLLARIRSLPERNPPIGRLTRRAVLVRFPYIVLYVVTDDSIVITGVFHSHRDPRVWAGRVQERARAGGSTAPVANVRRS